MKELTIDELRNFLVQMVNIQENYPKTKVIFDAENKRIIMIQNSESNLDLLGVKRSIEGLHFHEKVV